MANLGCRDVSNEKEERMREEEGRERESGRETMKEDEEGRKKEKMGIWGRG